MRRVPVPKTVKVGCHSYSILRKSKAQMPDDLGRCNFDGVQIWLVRGLKLSVAQETLLHELLHACTYPSQVETTLTDEQFVEAISPVFLQVMQENPKLVEYLTQKV